MVLEGKRKKKVLALSDHALSTSGVGCQTRHLLNGLSRKVVGPLDSLALRLNIQAMKLL